MNRLLAQRLDADAQAIEPVYEGHHYYPFPALRLGPSLRQVVECSNLCRKAIDLTLVAARPCLFDSQRTRTTGIAFAPGPASPFRETPRS